MARLRFTLTRAVVQIDSLDLWTNRDDGGDPWTTGAAPTINFNTNGQESDLLIGVISNAVSGENEFTVELNIAETGGANVVDVELILLDASFNELDSDTTAYTTPGDKTINVTLDAGVSVPSYVAIKSQVGATLSPPFTRDVTINSVEIVDSVDLPESLEISEPDGWKGAKIILERHSEFMSLIEYYEGAANGGFIFYGSDGVHNGGIDFIKGVEQAYGFDAELNITVEYSPDNLTYEQLFTGQLDLSAKNEMKDNRMQVPVIRDNFWSTFINRMDTPVDLSSLTDLDGNEVDPVGHVNVYLSSQKLRTEHYSFEKVGFLVSVPEDYYFFYSPDIIEIDELTEFSILPRVTNTVVPSYMFALEFDGACTFDICIEYSRTTIAGYDSPRTIYDWFFQKNDEAPIEFSYQEETYTDASVYAGWDVPPVTSDVVTAKATFNQTIQFNNGDVIRIYLQHDGSTTGHSITIWGQDGTPGDGSAIGASARPSGMDETPTFFRIYQDTIHPATISEGYLIHDLFHGVLARLGLGTNPFYSEYLGSDQTTARQYEENGCFWNMAIFKGLQIRQYTLSEKPFFISFKQLWDGMNPIANLGLGYEVIDDVQVIRIEEKAHWFDITQSLQISNVREIGSNYDQNHIFKTIKTGYKKWQSENASGIDDPQTKHTYATRFLKTGKEINIESDFVAASLAVETTRRKVKEKTADYKFDNDNFIIALRTESASPSLFYPEVDENFTSITGLLNSSTRYNSILTPLRNLLRWGNYLAGCLQSYTGSLIKFVSGEGNYDMISDYDCAGGNECQAVLCGSIAENSDVRVSDITSYLFVPIEYPMTIPMSWADFTTIRASLKKSIGVSQTEASHAPFFINKFEYNLVEGKVTGSAWPKSYFNIQVIDIEKEMAGCASEVSGGGGVETCFRITEDEFIRITEDGNNRVPEDCDA